MATNTSRRIISILALSTKRSCFRPSGYRQYSTGNLKSSGFTAYWKSLKWFSIPASVGFAYIGYLQFRHIQKREKRNLGHGEPQSLLLDNWQVEILKMLPTRVLSRWWGYLSHLRVPLWMRQPLFGLYVKLYDCNMEESMIEDLKQFPTFSDFFKRKLRPDARTINEESAVVSPVDGKILYFGELDSLYNMEQVKGVSYSLVTFCGPKHPFVKGIIKEKERRREQRLAVESTTSHAGLSKGRAVTAETPDGILNGHKTIDINKNTANVHDSKRMAPRSKYYYCIMYLAPGDYHWFHSPTDWTIEHRRHIPGHLFSVSPSVMRSIQGLFNFNERVLLHGHWEHGQFMMAAIGAYNVGSIHLPFAVEKTFKTNIGKLEAAYSDRLYGAAGFTFKRGEPLGGFDLGSSIVLIFTAPENLKFHVQPGQKINYGQPLASLA
eukprot:Seg782.21 transcript_id=Seg782.21/GoldUCD/mRNA.D3Y31 product="Phosphatidylserine decarboxylase proenzyme mitochondrial" protein_id=Seg782.21/GoldUCD/D3Y31